MTHNPPQLNSLTLNNSNTFIGNLEIYELHDYYYLYSTIDRKLILAGSSIQEAREFAILKFYEEIDSFNRSCLK